MANELSIDLIVLGTPGRTGFGHLFFGSTAESSSPLPLSSEYASEKGFKANDAST